MIDMDRIKFGLSNFYGQVFAVEEDGKYFICLDCYSGTNKKEISEEFYLAIQNEFGGR
jgi:hypothetical protein